MIRSGRRSRSCADVRIFVDPAQLAAGELVVSGDEHHYLGRVRRARIGETVELVDGAGRRAAAVIMRIGEADSTLDVASPERIAPQLPHLRVLLPLIKGERMDYALEKLVEVGVDALVIFPAVRSVVKLEPDRRASRLGKYTAALQAAARQSGCAQVPTLDYAPDLAAALARLPATTGIVLDPASSTELAALPPPVGADVTVLSGPEGGLAPGELQGALAAHFTPLGLGPRILRAETAPVIAVALLRYRSPA